MGQLTIKPAVPSDADTVWSIVKACSDWLVSLGHTNWQNNYDLGVIKHKLSTSHVFLASLNDLPIAVIALDQNPVDYYTPKDIASFADPQATSYYITTLGVLPQYQEQGIASKLLDFATDKARKVNIKYLRLECKALYLKLVSFYRHRGFRVVGVVTDPDDNYEPYFLMEKTLA